MAEVATPATPASADQEIGDIKKNLADLTKLVIEKSQPVRPGGLMDMLAGGRAPWGTSGPVGNDSAGYSIVKAAGYCQGILSEEDAKEEVQVSKQLRKIYEHDGFKPQYQSKSFLMPASTRDIPIFDPIQKCEIPERQKFVGELREKMGQTITKGLDLDEARWLNNRTGGAYTKALGTINDTAGGVLIGFPSLGELIDMQRNLEVFTNAGAQEITLPPNGRIAFPKLQNGATAYWVGEAAPTNTSQETTGQLLLEGKKLGIIVPVNNELFRYTTGGTAEAMIRLDMARVSALAADLAMLTGTGGTQIAGILTYNGQTSWSSGNDKLLTYQSTVGSAQPVDGNHGYTFQPEDILFMDGALPDAVDKGTAWIVRKDWFANIVNRRADSAMPGDGKGPFIFDMWRSISMGTPREVGDTKVVRSRQVSNTRVRGTATNLTYALYGYFPDWIIARHGVMEFLANPYDSTGFSQDQTLLRGIQILDAGARHPASFILADQLAFA
jgi:HK97 family phage major capsid protein